MELREARKREARKKLCILDANVDGIGGVQRMLECLETDWKQRWWSYRNPDAAKRRKGSWRANFPDKGGTCTTFQVLAR